MQLYALTTKEGWRQAVIRGQRQTSYFLADIVVTLKGRSYGLEQSESWYTYFDGC
jgi:hypothetical protein